MTVNEKRVGYKKTKLGWIPEDWKIVKLIGLSKTGIRNGVFNDPKKVGRGYRLINVVNLYTEPKIKTDQLNRIDINEKEYKRYKVEKGDIFFTRSSLKLEGIAHCNIYHDEDKDIVYDCHIMMIRPIKDIAEPYFLRCYFISNIARRYFMSHAKQVTMTTISQTDIDKMPVPLPPLPEQKKIAEILSTWDRAIELTEKLIQAESSRKKGLMQQLLTGKKRFGEFVKSKDFFETKLGLIPEDWKVKKANQIFKNYSQKSNENEQLLSATQENGVIPRDMIEGRVTMPQGSTNSFKLVDIGDFVISLRSFQGGLEYSNYRGIVSPAYTVLKPKTDIDKKFYKYYFKSRDFISHLAVAVIGIRDGKQISYNDFSVMNLPYPPIPEQQKISTVLTTCDQKLTLLNKKLEALKTQKKGLMQKLLTGAVRVKT